MANSDAIFSDMNEICSCGMTHSKLVPPLATKEVYEAFMNDKVKVGGGKFESIREVTEKGITNDFPEWQTKPIHLPAVDDAATDPVSLMDFDLPSNKLYDNYAKFLMRDIQNNLRDLLEELENFVSIAYAENNEEQENRMQTCVETIKNIQSKRQCGKSLKVVVKKVIELAAEVTTERRTDLKAAPIKFKKFYGRQGETKRPKRFEVEIFKDLNPQTLFNEKQEVEVVVDDDGWKLKIDQLKHNIQLIITGIDVMIGEGVKDLDAIILLLKDKKAEDQLKKNIKNRQKERESVFKVLAMLKTSRLCRNRPCTIIHSYDFNWLNTIKNWLNKNKISGDHDTGVIVPLEKEVLVVFIQIKGCDTNTKTRVKKKLEQAQK